MILRAVNSVCQLGIVLFLARLLAPEDYGLVSMVLAITGFAYVVVDLGTRDAVVQRARITEGEIAALFWITLTVGVCLTLLVAASSPLIAWFYAESRLVSITLVSSLTFVTAALSCQHQALLRRAMKFQELALIEVAAGVLSAAVAITMAFRGWHYWALVIRPIAMNILIGAGVWFHCRWSPVRPTLTQGVKEMLKFGINGIGFNLTDFAGQNGDRVVIGKSYGANRLGHYQNALMVYGQLLDLSTSLLTVAIGSLSKLSHDLKEFRRVWAKALSTLTFYAMPAFGIMAVTSQDLIVLVLGSKWSAAGTLLSILALRGIPHVVERTVGWLHVPAGRTDRLLRWGVFAASAQLVALIVGSPFFPIGIAIAYVICMYVLFVPGIAYAGRPLGIGAADVIRATGPQLLGAVTAAAFGFLLRYTVLADTPGLERAAVLALAYTISYLAVVVGFFRVRMPLTVAMALGRDVMPARFAR
jgi:polysaccharide transporter, PST family